MIHWLISLPFKPLMHWTLIDSIGLTAWLVLFMVIVYHVFNWWSWK